MPRRRLSTMQDCEDLIRGCLVMGTGGGGSAERGREVFTAALEEGLEIEWIDVDDIPDDAWTITPYGMGSIAPTSPEALEEISRLGLVDRLGHRSMEVAVREMEEYAQVKIKGIVPVDLGDGNTPAPLVAGARLGIPVVGGDYAGRAIPEEMQGTPYLYDNAGWPFTSVDRWGNVCIVREVCSLHKYIDSERDALNIPAFGEWFQWLAERLEQYPQPEKQVGAHIAFSTWKP